jgi:hypothetical protein
MGGSKAKRLCPHFEACTPFRLIGLVARKRVRSFFDHAGEGVQTFIRDRVIESGEVFLPFGFCWESLRRDQAPHALDMPNPFNIKPELHAERHLANSSHHFDRECVGLDLLFALLDWILRMSVVFFQRVSQLVREQKDNGISKIPICAIRHCGFFTRIIGNTESAKNGRKRSSRRERCLA